MNEKIDINPIPYLTWSWLKINSDPVSYDFTLTENAGKDVQIPDGVLVSSGKTVQTALEEPKYSIGEQAAKLISDAAPQGKIYTIEKSTGDKPLIIRIAVDANSATHQIIHAKAGVTAKVIIIYEGGPSTGSGTPV